MLLLAFSQSPWFWPIVFLVVAVCLSTATKVLNPSAAWIGRRGEKLTERELKLVNALGRSGRILRNVYVPKEDGGTSEIDVLYICQKGILVIESKNYSGWIFGSENQTYWTVSLPNRHKEKFYNPIKQNKTHIKWLKRYLDAQYPLFSLIVFSERCELKKITLSSGEARVLKRDRLYANVREIWEQSPDCLSEEQINLIYDKLNMLTNVDASVKQAHIESIQNRFGKEKEISQSTKLTHEISSQVEESNLKNFLQQERESLEDKECEKKEGIIEKELISEMDTCPQCGGKLIDRMATSGVDIGKVFQVCEHYPTCKYYRLKTTK